MVSLRFALAGVADAGDLEFQSITRCQDWGIDVVSDVTHCLGDQFSAEMLAAFGDECFSGLSGFVDEYRCGHPLPLRAAFGGLVAGGAGSAYLGGSGGRSGGWFGVGECVFGEKHLIKYTKWL